MVLSVLGMVPVSVVPCGVVPVSVVSCGVIPARVVPCCGELASVVVSCIEAVVSLIGKGVSGVSQITAVGKKVTSAMYTLSELARLKIKQHTSIRLSEDVNRLCEHSITVTREVQELLSTCLLLRILSPPLFCSLVL